jgi:hypothetical protein
LDHTKIEQIIRRTLNLRFRKIKENKNYTPNIPTTHYLQLTIPGIHAKNQVRLFLVFKITNLGLRKKVIKGTYTGKFARFEI